MILDAPIRRAMLEAKAYIVKSDLASASKKMYEALGAFKFIPFGYLSDARAEGIALMGIKLSRMLSDLAFKIILADDEVALKKIMNIKTEYTEVKNGKVGVRSYYPIPQFKDKEEANEDYEENLDIILTYQDRVPSFLWRKKQLPYLFE